VIREFQRVLPWLAVIACVVSCDSAPRPWSAEEAAILESLWIESLPDVPADPSNRVADDPRAAAFGRQLFFDTRLSANESVSCATCHQPALHFTDGLQRGVAIGTSRRNTPSIVGTAYSPWLYRDGRRDSQWSQALVPLEDPNEHGSDREEVMAAILGVDVYRRQYESLFGAADDVDTVFANVGKALAAFERTILPTASRFDKYVAAVVAGDAGRQRALFSPDEVRGLRLFIGKANCTQCHNGPLFTNNEFHNTGLINFPGEVPDKGRVVGVREVLADLFNCRGDFNDNPSPSCPELEFARTGPELIGAFRTPSLRNVPGTAPYGHKGQLATLADVLEHYNEAPDAMIGHNEAKPLDLGRGELQQLEAFLMTLEAPSSFTERLIEGRL
jgi:cytochrome c peroxidase